MNQFNPVRAAALLALAGALPVAPLQAQSLPSTGLQTVQVTATRFGEAVQQVPGSISVVGGDELRARGANDLRTALALLGGVSVAPGGDAGPAGAVPGLLGVREVDDLLLLIDGIPAGGAFTPQVTAISLVNVERIEVLRGSAPVYFGTTAFAGTINVIHYAAGRADSGITLRAGSHGSVGASGAAVLSTGAVRQSVALDLGDEKLSDPRAGARRAQGSWRLATDLAGGALRADLNLQSLRQKPNSPTPYDETIGGLSTLLPRDFNQNPANARIDSERGQIVLGFERTLPFGHWGSTLSHSRTHADSVRGFIDMGDSPPPWTAASVADLEAFHQTQRLRETFIDSHLNGQPMAGLDLTTGVNVLLGRAGAHSLRYAHKLPLDGASALGDIETVSPKGTVELNDRRRFVGLYAQGRYALSPSASLLAGLRWNSTHERRDETRVNRAGVVTRTEAAQDIDRLSGSLGGQWTAWQGGTGTVDALTLHASVGNTFQPAQIDFSPNPEVQPEGGGLLRPETQRSVVFGLKADALRGLAEFDIDGFVVDFDHQPIQTTVAGGAVLRSGGRQRYTGIDFEGALHPAPAWTLKAQWTWSDAHYRDFVTEVDGTPTQLSGKRQVLTPATRAGAGLIYAPSRGWRGSLTTQWTGRRWLNRLNTDATPAYAVVDASIGYRFERCTVQLAASNLGNRRDPVQASELGEDQFYRLPGRRLEASVVLPLP